MIQISTKVFGFDETGEEMVITRDWGLCEYQAMPRNGDIIICPDDQSYYVTQVVHRANGPSTVMLMEQEE